MKTSAAVLAAALCLSAPAGAATLDATSLAANLSSFSIAFTDSDGDGRLDIGEVTAFSGLTLSGFGAKTLTAILAIPAIPGIADAGSAPGALPVGSGFWAFDAAGALDGAADLVSPAATWSYTISGLAPVPLPTGLPLLAGAVAALGLACRGRGRATA